MEPDESNMLVALKDLLHVSKGHIIRELIRAHYMMEIGGIPQCANGRRCSCPQLVMTPPAPAFSPPLPTPKPIAA